MTKARGFAYLGQVDDFEIKFFLCLHALPLWRLVVRFHTELYHAVGSGRSLSPRTYSLRAREERLALDWACRKSGIQPPREAQSL